MTTDLSLLKASDFAAYLNGQVYIRFTKNERLSAELIEVKESENYSPLERTAFFIVFRTEQKNATYKQGVYTVEHPQKGELPIFLVPLGPDGKGMKYEAVFS